jgi:hypothetical protein
VAAEGQGHMQRHDACIFKSTRSSSRGMQAATSAQMHVGGGQAASRSVTHAVHGMNMRMWDGLACTLAQACTVTVQLELSMAE